MKRRISILIIIFILFSIPAWAIYQSSTFGNRSGVAAGGDVTPPAFSSASVAADGTTFTINLSENVTTGAGGNGGFVATGSTTGASAITVSDITNNVITGSSADTFVSGETITLAYTQPGDGIEDLSGNDLANFSGESVTNNVPLGCGTTKAYVASSYRSNSATGAAQTIATSATFNFVTGHTGYVVVAGYVSGTAPTVTGVSDGTNSWTYVGRQTDAGGSVIELWYHYFTGDKSTATVTATFSSASTTYRAIGMGVFTGGLNGDQADGYETRAKGTTVTAHTTDANIVTTCDDDVLIAGFSHWDAFNHSPGTNWTLLSAASGVDFDFAYRIVTATGTYPSGTIVTTSGATYSIGIMGAFK